MKHLASAVFLLAPLFCGAFPKNELSNSSSECYKCNSKFTPDCAQNPTASLDTDFCKDPHDRCITAIVDRITHRGCEKEVKAPSNAISKTCTDPRCNNEFFPKDRLKCYQCEGSNCRKDLQDYLKPCVNYDQNDSCITDVIDETDVVRRCRSDPDYSFGQYAEKCQESGCNNHPTTYISECVACSEANSTFCVKRSVQSGLNCTVPKDNTCKETLLLNRPIQCFTYVESNNVVRGCLKNAGNLAKDTDNFKPCEGQLCNNKCLLIKCVKCNSKTNPKCTNQAQNLEPETCLGDNACFTAQNAEGAIIRGCGAQSLEAKKIISSCHDDGCNNEDYPLTKKMECYKCDSNNFAECATNPSASLPHAMCADPKDSCFIYKSSTKIVRGCTKDAGELAKDVNNFSTCEGPMCNDKYLPLKCITCDSKVDPRCTQRAKEIEPQKCTSETACFSGQTSEGSIIRGCGAKSTKAENITSCYVDGCNSKEYPQTTSCQGTNCNSKKIECYQCDSVKRPECATYPSAILPHDQCEDPNDKCITAIVDGVTYRGCGKEVPAGYTLVDKCDSNLCNIQIFPKNRTKCYQCEGKDCVKNFEKYLRPCADFNEDTLCVTMVEMRTNVIRKCLSHKDNSVPIYAEKCKGSGCNNHPATYEAQCLFCDESTDLDTYCVRSTPPFPPGEKCTIPVANFTTCTYASLLNRPISCFTYTKSGRVRRGCTGDVGNIKFDKENFKECEGPMCNNECVSIKCISCNSKKDERCIKMTNWLEYQNCPNQMSCFYAQTKEGEVIRGCGHPSSELTQITTCYSDGCNDKALSPPNISPCQGANCNNGDNNGPQKHCYHCKDSNDCRNTPDKSLLKPCASPSDGCMQYVNHMHEMVRGCKSDSDYDKCLKKGKECLQCTEDGCNNVEAIKTAKLSCLLCDTTDTNCLYTINKEASTKCSPKAPFYVDSFGCYSCLSKDKKTANRGCYYGETYTSNDDSTCRTCTTDDCNDESLFVQSCIQCEGDSGSCNGGLSGTVCKGIVYSHNLGCYAKKIGDKMKRGCISDLEDPRICKGDEQFCQYCLGQDCNNSGTTKLLTSFGVLLIPLLLSLYFTF